MGKGGQRSEKQEEEKGGEEQGGRRAKARAGDPSTLGHFPSTHGSGAGRAAGERLRGWGMLSRGQGERRRAGAERPSGGPTRTPPGTPQRTRGDRSWREWE